ncbi:MAG: DNA polymerase III subunit delta [Deltaproteobacteria bacterium]|nr:MAG: DNA polymerase III subunit delta [Deltaproteobacteria bacterium]
MSSSPLTDALEQGVRAIYLYGEPPLLLDAAADEAEIWAKQRCGLPSFNFGRWRGDDPGADTALSAARTVPMMSDLRVVVVRDLERAQDGFHEALVDYLSDPSPSTLLIAVAGPFGKPRKGQKAWGTRLVNAFKKAGYVQKFSSSGVHRARFVAQRAADQGLSLAARDAALLVELVGEDLGALALEVDKLAVYVGEGPVRAEDLRAVCSALAEEEVWELTTGLAQRDPALALRALHRLLADAKEPHYLLAMVVMQLRKVAAAVQLVQRGASDGVIGRQLRLRAADVGRIRALADSAPPPVEMLERVLRANREMNSHRAGSARVLEALVVEMTT